MRNIFHIAIGCTLIALASCTETSVKEPQTSSAEEHEREWTRIRPEEIKNSVSLFNDDWMILSSGDSISSNGMTISWGALGEIWSKPAVTVYVRPSRYTMQLLSTHKYFTVCSFDEEYRDALKYMGSHSGREDKNKAASAGLTTEFTPMGNPRYKEARLCLECRIMYRSGLNAGSIDPNIFSENYEEGEAPHIMFIGEIVNAWER